MTTFKFAGKPKAENIASLLKGERNATQQLVHSQRGPNIVEIPAASQSIAVYQHELQEREARASEAAQIYEGRRAAERRKVSVNSNLAAIHFGNGDDNEEEAEDVSDHRSGTIERASSSIRSSQWSANRSVAASKRDARSDRGDSSVKSRKLAGPTDSASNNDSASEMSGGTRTASTINTGTSRATIVGDTAIEKYRKDIITAINSNSVTVIRGPTGCGKSTCVPRFVLEDARANKKPVKIVVTEPRRIAALSLAQRICDVEGWQVGSVCGYQVGLEPNVGPDTLLTYCTTGVLLEKLIYASADSEHINYTHIIVDEVHERDIEIELLLLILHHLIDKRERENQEGFKLVLMSATMPSDIIQQFSTVWNDDELPSDLNESELLPEPLARRVAQINVVERRHDVAVLYLNKFAPTMCNEMSIEHVQFKKDEAAVDSALYDVAARLIASFDEDEKREMRRATAISGWSTLAPVGGTSLPNLGTAQTIVRGAVLVFVPGYFDIIRLSKKLRERDLADRLHLVIVPLHSSIPLEEQRAVFAEVSKHERKVIIATNIAQSSITVADVKYVIDFCLEKKLVCDRQSQFTGLELCWASKSAMEQRRGRAGRVTDGTCYRLIPDCLFEELDADESPAVKRVPLERTVLKIKVWDRVSPWCLLRRSEHNVDKWQVAQAILSLKEVGALTLASTPDTEPASSIAATTRNIDTLLDGLLTYVGYVLASLPIDVHAGRLVLLGHAFGVLRDAVIIAAGMQSRSVFSMPFQAELESFESKLNWSAGSYSDLLALRNAYLLWKRKRLFEFTRRSDVDGSESFDYDAERRWCKQHFLQLRDLHEMDKLVTEIQTRLKRHSMYFDFIESEDAKSCKSESQKEPVTSFTRQRNEDDFILKVCIAGAFYPYYFVRPFDPALEHGAAKQLNDLDPLRTVALHGLPQDSGCLYREQLAERFARSYGTQFVTLRKPLVVVRDTHAFVHFHDYVGRRGPTSVDERYYMHASGSLDVPTPVLLALKMGDLARVELLRFDATFAHDAASEYHRIEQWKQRHAAIRRRLERLESYTNADAQSDSSMHDTGDAASSRTSMTLTSACETEHAAYERAPVAVPNPPTLSYKLRVRVFLESVIDCASFYVRLYTGLPLQQTINDKLNELGEHSQLRRLDQSATAKLREHQLCVAHFRDENGDPGWYRAQIRALDFPAATADVYFVDYGNEETRSFTQLFELPEAVGVRRFPWQAFRFVVSHVRPSALINGGQAWPTSGMLWMREMLANWSNTKQRSAMFIELFSVVDNVARGDFIISTPGGEVSVREKLIGRCTAQRSEEPFASRTWHSQRTKAAARIKQAGVHAAGDTDSLFDTALRDSGPTVNNDNWSISTKQETQSECASAVMDVEALIDPDERDSAAEVNAGSMKSDTFGRFNSLSLQRPRSPMSVSCHSNSQSRSTRREEGASASASADVDEDELLRLEQEIDRATHELETRIAAKYDELRQSVEARQPARNASSATALRFATAPGSSSGAAKVKQETITLTGPDHPLRFKFKPVMRTLQKASVRVDRSSLNAVAIDTEPQTRCERLLVAGSVSSQIEGRAVSLRWTTLMPAIPCFAPLVALMFAPSAELRIDNPQRPTRYTGVLSGLGFDEKRRMPLFPDHDLEFVFDAAIEHEDLVAINRLRSVLNVLFGSEGLRDQAIRRLERDRYLKGVERDNEDFKKRRLEVLRECGWEAGRVFKWQSLLRQLVIKILSRDRNSATRIEPARLFDWGIVPTSLHMTSAFDIARNLQQKTQHDENAGLSKLGLDTEQQRAACHYPSFIRQLQLVNLKDSETPTDTIQGRQLQDNIDRLHKTNLLEALVTNTIDKRVFNCPICDEVVERSCGFIVHINDASHIQKRAELERVINAGRELAAQFAARNDRFGGEGWFSSIVDSAGQELPPPGYNHNYGESYETPYLQPHEDVGDRLGTDGYRMFEAQGHFSNEDDARTRTNFDMQAEHRAQPTSDLHAFGSGAPYDRERAGCYPPAAPRDFRSPYDGRAQPFSRQNLPPAPAASYGYAPVPQGYFHMAVPQQTIVNSTNVTYNIHVESPSSSNVSDQRSMFGNRADVRSISVRREQHQVNTMSPLQSDYPPFGASVQPLMHGRATTNYTYSHGRGRGRGRGRGEAPHQRHWQQQYEEYESGPERVNSTDRRVSGTERQFGNRWNDEGASEREFERYDQYYVE